MISTDLVFDVTTASAIGEPVHIAATLHLPKSDAPTSLVFAIHGGG